MNLVETPTETLLRTRDAASQAYYAGESIMTDDAFDALTAEIASRGIEEKTGHGYVPTGVKIRHDHPMLSLLKVRSEDEVANWVQGLPSGATIQCQPKLDGLSVSLTYDGEGEIESAATRGDGLQGEDVLHTIRAMGGLDRIESTGRRVNVRGEIVMTHDMFQRLNEGLDGESKYRSPRNAAAGLLRRHDTSMAKHLTFIAYDADDADTFSRLPERVPALVDLEVSFDAGVTRRIMEAIDNFSSDKSLLPYDTDGVVVKVMDQDTRDEMGTSNSAPRWAIAYKYPSSSKETVLRSVEWSTGRTGRIVPTAVFDPVMFGDVTVDRATLHNLADLQERDLRIGDTITVTRSNEVIPYIARVDHGHAKDSVPVSIPDKCPASGAGVHVEGCDLVSDLGAEANVVGSITYSLACLGVLGIGSGLVSDMVRHFGVENVIDLFDLTYDQIVSLPRQGDTSANNALDRINQMRDASLSRWIAAIGLPMIGSTLSPDLAWEFGSLDALSEATLPQVMAIPKFGETKSRSVVESRETIKKWADALRAHGVVPSNPELDPVIESEFSDLRVCVTGTIPGMSRAEAETWLIDHGAVVQGAVSSKTDLLIAGERAGSKRAKATQLGVEIMDGAAFAERVEKG